MQSGSGRQAVEGPCLDYVLEAELLPSAFMWLLVAVLEA